MNDKVSFTVGGYKTLSLKDSENPAPYSPLK